MNIYSDNTRAEYDALQIHQRIVAGQKIEVVKVVRPQGHPEGIYPERLREALVRLGLDGISVVPYTLPPGIKGLQASLVIMDDVEGEE